MSLKKILLCFFVLSATLTKAQQSDQQLGAWYMYNGSHKIADKFAIKTMAHYRYYEVLGEFQQEIYRLGLNYTINPKINFTVGYSYVNTNTEFKVYSNILEEHRFYEDLNLKGKLNNIKLRHRLRFEHRFFNSTSSHWFRYDLNANYPITKSWSVYAFNELFLNIDKSKRFVQNWTGAGFLHQINQQLKLKLGYFYQKLPDKGFHRLQFGIILNTNHLNNQK